MKVSIVTVVINGEATIADCLDSVASQTYPHIEHIVIDGGSSDGTIDLLKRHEGQLAYWISEKDDGVYDAMNKGIKASTGDIIGILNSDDVYAAESVIGQIVTVMTETNSESCYGDVSYVARNDLRRIIRYWKSGEFRKERFKQGWMAPHPTFFVRREVYQKYGLLNLDFPLAADYEIMVRLLYKYGISTSYIPRVLVNMRLGGISRPGWYTIKAIRENYRAWKVNDLKPNPITFVMKPLSKFMQFLPPGRGSAIAF